MPDLRGPLGRHPENEANRGGIWIPAKWAAQVRDDGVLPRLVTTQQGEVLTMTYDSEDF
jgi:hypothetical protein